MVNKLLGISISYNVKLYSLNLNSEPQVG